MFFHRLYIYHGFVHVTCSVCFKLRYSVLSCYFSIPELGKLSRFRVGSPKRARRQPFLESIIGI